VFRGSETVRQEYPEDGRRMGDEEVEGTLHTIG
jgi:hypothetical protein